MSDDIMFDSYQREEMESSAETGKRLADADSTVLCEFLLALVQAWRYELTVRRVNGDLNSEKYMPVPYLCETGQVRAEEAIQELWRVVGWQEPFADLIQQRADKRIEWYRDANRKLSDRTGEVLQNQKVLKDDQKRILAKVDDELRRLIGVIDSMLAIDVTHQERRGQLKVLQELIGKIRQFTDDVSDIPF